MNEHKNALRLIIEMLEKKLKQLKTNPLARNGHRRYNPIMEKEQPEFTADPMQPSPALLRQIAKATKEAKPTPIVLAWANAFFDRYPNE